MGQRENNVAVIYNNDASSWCEYIKQEVKRVDQLEDEINFSYIQDTDMFPTMNKATENSLCSAKVIVVIASPAFILGIQEDKMRECVIPDPTNAVLFLCGVTVEHLETSGIAKRFHQFDIWTKITHEKPHDLLLRIVVNVENAAGNPTPLCALKARQAAADKCGGPNSGAATTYVDPKWAFDITPSHIRSEQQTEVVMFFHNQVPDGCQLNILVDQEKLLVRKRNPYTFSFTAPEHREGEVHAVLECHDERIGELTLKYDCDLEKINGLIQIHLQALELICKQSRIHDLDRTLSKLFDEKSGTIPVAAVENLFGMHEYAAHVNLQHELPTLLHFAAKYGLKEFASQLIDLPGALLAYSTGNKDGDRPAQIARKFEHVELANYFDTYIEMNGTLYEMIEPYMSFNIDSPCYMEMQAYYNSADNSTQALYSVANPVVEELYIDMSGNKSLPGYMVMNRPKPALERPKTKRQEELYDIFMLLHDKKISASESQSLINSWVNKHAGGRTFKNKQQRLTELNAELKMWNAYNRECAGYYNHTNKSEFIQYMLRQLKRQLADSGYMYATQPSAEGNSNNGLSQDTYMYSADTQPSQPFQPSGDIYEANPTSPKPAAPKPTSPMGTTPKPATTKTKPIPGGGHPQPRIGVPRARQPIDKDRRKSIRMETLINDNGIRTPPTVPKRQAAAPPLKARQNPPPPNPKPPPRRK